MTSSAQKHIKSYFRTQSAWGTYLYVCHTGVQCRVKITKVIFMHLFSSARFLLHILILMWIQDLLGVSLTESKLILKWNMMHFKTDLFLLLLVLSLFSFDGHCSVIVYKVWMCVPVCLRHVCLWLYLILANTQIKSFECLDQKHTRDQCWPVCQSKHFVNMEISRN